MIGTTDRTLLMRLLLVSAVALVISACATGSPSTAARGGLPVSVAPGSVPSPDHVLIVMFENKSYEQVLESGDAPYLSSLARSGANFTNAHGLTHPSQGNYIGLFAGSLLGVEDNTCPQDLGNAPNLGRQLLDSGHSFVGYAEALPSVGFTGCGSANELYARKHNPWVNFANLPMEVNQPATALPTDFRSLPTVSMWIPDMCHDMHDCDVRTGDDWAAEHLPAYVEWARRNNGLLMVMAEEDDGTEANRIPFFMIGPMVRAGDSNQRIDHYTTLRTLEEMYRLPPLGSAATTPPISGVWNVSAPSG